MRYGPLGWIMIGAWLGAFPAAAHADYLATAKAALQKGDLKAAQIDLRNAVRDDPQNAEAHYWLGRVTFELGIPSPRNARPPRHAIAASIRIRPFRCYRGPCSRSKNSTRCWSS
jgi:hypothetical protein